MLTKEDPQLIPSPYLAFCEVFLCRKRAQYRIGRPDGPLQATMNICEECAKKIALSGVELFPELLSEKEEVKEEAGEEKPEKKPKPKKKPKADLFNHVKPFEEGDIGG